MMVRCRNWSGHKTRVPENVPVHPSFFLKECVYVVVVAITLEAVTPLGETCRFARLSFPPGQQACREILRASHTSVGGHDDSTK